MGRPTAQHDQADISAATTPSQTAREPRSSEAHDHGDDAAIHGAVDLLLAKHDSRYTGSRRRLVEVLAESGKPVTLPEIVAAAPGLATSSAYRNLEVLERCGVVTRIASGADHAHFELAEPLLGHHHHLICVGCDTIEDFQLSDAFEQELTARLDDIASGLKFTTLDHSLDIRGLCSDCQ